MASDGAKALLPFLQRADEMARHDRRVAYYCRLYALEQGLALPGRTEETNALLGTLLKQLEADKPSAGLADDDGLYMEGFASRIFNKADALDRTGRSDAATAKALYASSIFFEVLRQFGDLAPEHAARQRYAAWRAAEIRAAVKEGRPPAAAPSAAPADAPQPPAPAAHVPVNYSPAAAFPSTPPPMAAAAGGAFSPSMERGRPSLGATPSPPPGLRAAVLTDLPGTPSASGLPISAVVDAQTAAKIAASALSFDDVPTAVTHLRKALHALRAA